LVAKIGNKYLYGSGCKSSDAGVTDAIKSGKSLNKELVQLVKGSPTVEQCDEMALKSMRVRFDVIKALIERDNTTTREAESNRAVTDANQHREVTEVYDVFDHNLELCLKKADVVTRTSPIGLTKLFFNKSANADAVSFMFNRRFACSAEQDAKSVFESHLPGIYALIDGSDRFKDAPVDAEL
jgi:hypothetical protein